MEGCLAENEHEKRQISSALGESREENSALRRELLEAKRQLDEFRLEKSENVDQLENCVKQAREAELAERKLNTALHRQLEIEQENVTKLRGEIKMIKNKIDDESHQDRFLIFPKNRNFVFRIKKR